jgi:hypothetical protein
VFLEYATQLLIKASLGENEDGARIKEEEKVARYNGVR